ncbi:MAG: DUF3810 domain-containing protein [Flavobacteriaceae bacterium]|nr:DUF3810 domain-containing protein [Flavobacteriaceae bacterium]
MHKHKTLIIALSIVPQYLFVKLIAKFPNIVENYYSNGIYVYISKATRFTFGWLPFSFGDLLYACASIYIVRWTILNRKRIIKDPRNWILDVFSAFALAYGAFHVFWGFNYYRLPIHERLDLNDTYTTETLIEVTQKLIKKSNAIHDQISVSDTLKITMPYTKPELIKNTAASYTALAKIYPQFQHTPRSVKTSLYSLALTYMGFSGYINPFTNEAHIDNLIPPHKYPTTVAHEEAHQIGYAAENETNFIGCLATIHNPDIYYQYSGYIFALRHCLNEVYRRDKLVFKELKSNIHKGILANYQESYDFWNAYQNPLEHLFKKLYGNFLKANNQDKGMASYSYVVALLVNYFQEKAF